MIAKRLKIAVVDDEGSVRRALERLLRTEGMQVDSFADAASFLAAMATTQHDCAVLDLHMPGLSGFDVLARLRQSAIKPSIIILTGRDTPDTRRRALAGGAAAYLVKPVDAAELLAAIDNAMVNASGEAE